MKNFVVGLSFAAGVAVSLWAGYGYAAECAPGAFTEAKVVETLAVMARANGVKVSVYEGASFKAMLDKINHEGGSDVADLVGDKILIGEDEAHGGAYFALLDHGCSVRLMVLPLPAARALIEAAIGKGA